MILLRPLIKKVLLTIVFICFYNLINAQINSNLIGSASDTGNNCFQITPDEASQSGGVWYDYPINFSNDFTIYYQNNFGNNDADGADGMAIVFKTTPNAVIGLVGSGLGYENITSSLIVEFDTWQNPDKGDPIWDHISIMINGISDHNLPSNLEGPVQASSTSQNIEDGLMHEVKIEWISATETLNVYFDCNLRLSRTQNFKSSVFNNDDSVFFGFVGSTGLYSNTHEVCFNRISFIDDFIISDETICLGESIQKNINFPSGNSYSWFPITGISNPNIANPIFSPTTTTEYTVTITDNCGDKFRETFIIEVNNVTPNFNQIPPICEGQLFTLPTVSIEGITGTWSPAPNSTTTTEYLFLPDNGQCTVPTNLTVTVNTITTPTFDPINSICEGDTLNPLPTTSKEGIVGTWSPELNNNTTTNYTFTPNSGQCADTSTLTVTVNTIITPTFDPINSICEGDTLDPLPTTSKEGIVGKWSPELNNNTTTNYTFTPNSGQCANVSTIIIEVYPISPLSMSTSILLKDFNQNQTIKINATGGSGIYQYQLNNGVWQNSPIFKNILTCSQQVFSVRDVLGCSTKISQSIETAIFYPKYFTPNGDMYNESWNIKCLESHPEAIISIFDRYGKLLKQIKPSNSGWNGNYNDFQMPSNDYWFIANYVDNNINKQIKGHFTLKR